MDVIIRNMTPTQAANLGWWTITADDADRAKYPPVGHLTDEQIRDVRNQYYAQTQPPPAPVPPSPAPAPSPDGRPVVTAGNDPGGSLNIDPVEFWCAWWHSNDAIFRGPNAIPSVWQGKYTDGQINDIAGASGFPANEVAKGIAYYVVMDPNADTRASTLIAGAKAKAANEHVEPLTQWWVDHYDGHYFDARGNRRID